MTEPQATSNDEVKTRTIRVAVLAVIAALCVAAIADWIHHDLSLLFVLAIAVIGLGSRGAVFESMFVVGIEATAVVVLAIATFSGSNSFLHAASAIVAVIAIGKIAFLQLHPDKTAAAAKEPDKAAKAEKAEKPAKKAEAKKEEPKKEEAKDEEPAPKAGVPKADQAPSIADKKPESKAPEAEAKSDAE